MFKAINIIKRDTYTIQYEIIDGAFYQQLSILDNDSNDICHFHIQMGDYDDGVRVYYISGRFEDRIRIMRKRYTDSEYMTFGDFCCFLDDVLRFIDRQD